MHNFQIFFLTLFLSVISFFALGAVGFLDYIDGIVMSIGLIIVALLSIIISLLVSINRQLKKRV
ncbi:hypothetical protein [Lysinibacillus xylanilyticus]|uniref:Uncharacterized protein n=1 Tax=Lysinibacillus xylanilyticus TaxID=582475 RepID=A0A2M9Q4G8_9BACI|nr:hypothetical protein [Lysinibacillus xylanilyticus]PJO42862.1 hypothetical protein CWD94_13810 [Lysinibacillus xylanilyticus]